MPDSLPSHTYAPPYPPAPIYPPFLTHRQITAITEQHKEAVRIFNEVINVERALIQQLIEAIDENYLKAIKNRTIGQFTGTILDITRYLKTAYGRISPAQLAAHDNEITNMVYDTTTPIDIVFNSIKDLMEYGEMADNTYTPNQSIQKAYNILNRCGIFREAIKEWNRLANSDETWNNFKNHFRTAHEELWETDALTMADTNYNANMVDDIVSWVTNNISNQLQENIDDTQTSPYHYSPSIPPVYPTPPSVVPYATDTSLDSNIQ